MSNGSQPAFPQSYEKDETRRNIINNGGEVNGLSKREYFAAMAMQGLCSNPFYAEQEHERGVKSASDYVMDTPLAMRAIEIADELLKQLES